MKWDQAASPIGLDTPPSIMLMGKAILEPNGVTRFRHPGLWSLHLYSFTGQVAIDGVTLPIRPGYVAVLPPEAAIEYRVDSPSTMMSAYFTVLGGLPTTSIRMMQDAGTRFDRLLAEFEEAMCYRLELPRRADARMWDLLWEINLLGAPAYATMHDIAGFALKRETVAMKAVQIIEARLGEELGVGKLAAELGVSHVHLIRCFKAFTGDTVIGYIQKRRVEHARMLLYYSPRPIKSIAAEVGIPDVQQFNKTVRRILGSSPTQVRQQYHPEK